MVEVLLKKKNVGPATKKKLEKYNRLLEEAKVANEAKKLTKSAPKLSKKYKVCERVFWQIWRGDYLKVIE